MTMHDYDRLINRVVDQEASEADWKALHTLAEADPQVWRELAQAQREHAAMSAAVERELACADRVEVAGHEHYSVSLTERFRVVTTWSGWVAAAVLALAWGGLVDLGTWTGRPESGSSASIGPAPGMVTIPANDPSQAYDLFITEGRRQGLVLGELPGSVIDVEVDANGNATSMIYLLQVAVKKDVDNLYVYSKNELGLPDPSFKRPVIFTAQQTRDPE
jgi:hypothetical protein